MDASVEEKINGFFNVRLKDGSSCLTKPTEDLSIGDKAEIVIRARKITIGYTNECPKTEGMNYFFLVKLLNAVIWGRGSYFVKLSNGQMLHVISFVRRDPHEQGDEVYVQIDPYHCRLLHS